MNSTLTREQELGLLLMANRWAGAKSECEARLVQLHASALLAANRAGMHGIDGWTGGRIGVSALEAASGPQMMAKVFSEMTYSHHMRIASIETPEEFIHCSLRAASHCMARTHWIGKAMPRAASEARLDRGNGSNEGMIQERQRQAARFESELAELGPDAMIFIESLGHARVHQDKLAQYSRDWGSSLEHAFDMGLIPNPVGLPGSMMPILDIALNAKDGWRVVLSGIHRDKGLRSPSKPHLGSHSTGLSIGGNDGGVDLGAAHADEQQLWLSFSKIAIDRLSLVWKKGEIARCLPHSEKLFLELNTLGAKDKPRAPMSL